MSRSASPDKPAYHLVGIGGVGMSALAEWLLASGHTVSGSDRSLEAPVLKPLQRMGAQLFPQDGSGVTAEKTLVFSTAIEEGNPDLCQANALKIPCQHRAEVIAHHAQGQRVVAISGTAGKTTMTALMGFILTEAGLDPNVINGGILLDWQSDTCLGASRAGASSLFIVEADESDRSFLRLEPDWAIISNLARDHFDYDETVSLFNEFSTQVQSGIVSGPGVAEVLDLSQLNADVHAVSPSQIRDGWVEIGGVEYDIPLPGEHNAWNAGLVIRCCLALGLSPENIQDALNRFSGVHRRLEKVGCFMEVDVYDDYAHNSMKMEAAIRTLQQRYPSVIMFWRPHGFKPLRIMFDDLKQMFSTTLRPEDQLFILPVYYAGGTADQSMNSDRLVTALQELGSPVHEVEDYNTLSVAVLSSLKPGRALLGMGARDLQISTFLKSLVD